jgi:cell division septum initiation protein DivIVA
MNDKGPNDLERIIENLKRSNFRLQEENLMLKKEIDFLREEIQAGTIKLMKGNN